jgi:deoxyribonuclease-4
MHSPMVFNLANMVKEDVVSKSTWSHRQMMNAFNGTKCGIVIHCGKCINPALQDQSMKQVIDIINTNHKPSDPLLLLENAAGQGTEIGITLDEFRKIREQLDRPNIGMCLDTCHAFAAGWYPYDPVLFLNIIEDFDPKFLRVIHLNDSERMYNSRIDRHANLGDGYIWKDANDEHLLKFVKECSSRDIDMVLETRNSVQDSYRLNHYLKSS